MSLTINLPLSNPFKSVGIIYRTLSLTLTPLAVFLEAFEDDHTFVDSENLS